MKVWQFGQAAIRSLAQHKLRSVLSSLGIVFGVGALVAMLAVAEGARQRILEQIERLGTNTLLLRSAAEDDVRLAGFEPEIAAELRVGVPGLERMAAIAEITAEVPDVAWERPPEILGTEPDYFAIKGLRARQGRLLLEHDNLRRSQVCVLGARVAQELGLRGRVGASLRCGETVLEVVGLLESRDDLDTASAQPGPEAIVSRDVDGSIFIPLTAASALGRTAARPSEMSLAFRSPELLQHAPGWIQRILSRQAGTPKDYALIHPSELMAQARDAQRVFHVVLAAAALISLLAGGVGITNILLASVSERTHEIGLRRAVGASQVHIVAQFLTEALCLSIAGAMAGLGAGVVGASAIAAYAEWPTSLTPRSIALAITMALVVGLSAGLYPAVRAARLDPMAALRHA